MFSFRVHKSPRYFEWKANPSRSVMVAGVGRSGTTWLGDVVSQMINARVVFEPCVSDKECNFLIDNIGEINLDEKFERPTFFLSPNDFDRNKPLIEHMLFGSIKGDWVDQDVRAGIYSKRVIKVIRANMFIGHIARSWPELKILYVIRSPHKVVESMLMQEMNGWKFDWNNDDILRCLETYSDLACVLERLDWDRNNLIDRLTLRWCIELKIALNQLKDIENCKLLQYEFLEKGEGWRDLALFLEDRGCRSVPPSHVLERISKTGYSGTKTTHLNLQQVKRIHLLAEIFGLSRWVV